MSCPLQIWGDLKFVWTCLGMALGPSCRNRCPFCDTDKDHFGCVLVARRGSCLTCHNKTDESMTGCNRNLSSIIQHFKSDQKTRNLPSLETVVVTDEDNMALAEYRKWKRDLSKMKVPALRAQYQTSLGRAAPTGRSVTRSVLEAAILPSKRHYRNRSRACWGGSPLHLRFLWPGLQALSVCH
jgi:hypothetical protein